ANDDAILLQPICFSQFSRLQSTLDNGGDQNAVSVFRLREGGVLVHHFGQQILIEGSPVDADADRVPPPQSSVDHAVEVLVMAFTTSDIAGVDAVFGQEPRTLRILGEQEMAVVVEVSHQGNLNSPALQPGNDLRHSSSSLFCIDRDSDD